MGTSNKKALKGYLIRVCLHLQRKKAVRKGNGVKLSCLEKMG